MRPQDAALRATFIVDPDNVYSACYCKQLERWSLIQKKLCVFLTHFRLANSVHVTVLWAGRHYNDSMG